LLVPVPIGTANAASTAASRLARRALQGRLATEDRYHNIMRGHLPNSWIAVSRGCRLGHVDKWRSQMRIEVMSMKGVVA
jgi:hypothetical protein